MSYSYINTVYPTFKHSKIYDTSMYNKLDSNIPIKTIETFEPQGLLQNDNLKFYNTPQIPYQTQSSPNINSNTLNNQKDKDIIEHLENVEKNDTKHQLYINHILECPECKNTLLKQFGIETQRNRNEELLELISYIIFGLLILFMLDCKKN